MLDDLLFTDSWATTLRFDTIHNMSNIINYDSIHVSWTWAEVDSYNLQNVVDIWYNIYIVFYLIALIRLVKTFYKFILWLLPFRF